MLVKTLCCVSLGCTIAHASSLSSSSGGHLLSPNTSTPVVPHHPETDPPLLLPPGVQAALDSEAADLAHGPAASDPFYSDVPGNASSSSVAPGSMLKVEEVDLRRYLLPPATAMTRIMYQSVTLNGSRVPASAFVLWPYAPPARNASSGGYPVVAWARGTSGFTVDGASSNHRSLVQHWLAPFPLAVNGYVVVAPDYAGLGVGKDAAGKAIVHEYLTLPSHADDLIYGVRAAQRHFRELSARFVVLGHSQGGGAAWAVAVRQARTPVQGYLGAVAIAPLVDIVHHLQPAFQELMGTAICPGVKSAFPGFEWGSVLTPQGEQRLRTILTTGAQWGSAVKLLQGFQLMRDGWRENAYVAKYNARASLVGKAVAGPLLVVHGEKDELLQMNYTASAVQEAVRSSPGNTEVEYVVLPGVGHDAALTASHRLWMDWIADRFAGKKSRHGRGEKVELRPARPVGSYQADLNWYLASTAEATQAPS